jgi:plasmid stabilization system protein ParE
MARFVLSPEARDDLREIRDYIARDSAEAARRVLSELRAAMRRLAEMPEMGHFREDLADEPLRFWPVHSYLIIYRPDRNPLEVVRVLSGYRDIAELLS